jgi:hypothetical protein
MFKSYFVFVALVFSTGLVACGNDLKTNTEVAFVVDPTVQQPVVSVPVALPEGQPDEYSDSNDPVQDAPLEPTTLATKGPWLGERQIQTPRQGNAAEAIAMDSQGNVLVAGTFDRSEHRDVHDDSGRIWVNEQPTSDVFVQKFSPSGELIWKRVFGGTGFDLLETLVVGHDDVVYIAGRSDSTNLRGLKMPPAVSEAGFLTAYSSDGKRLWTRRPGVSVSSIAVDVEKNVLVTGASCMFTPNRTHSGRPQGCGFYVAKYGPDGVRWWTRSPQPGVPYEPSDTPVFPLLETTSIISNSRGEIIVAGNTEQSILGTANQRRSSFLLRLSPNGSVIDKPFILQGDGRNQLHTLQIDPDDNLLINATTNSKQLLGVTSTRIQKIEAARLESNLKQVPESPKYAEESSKCPYFDFEMFSCTDILFMKFSSTLQPLWLRFLGNELNAQPNSNDPFRLRQHLSSDQAFIIASDGSFTYLFALLEYVLRPNQTQPVREYQNQIVRFSKDGHLETPISEALPRSERKFQALGLTASKNVFVAVNTADPTVIDPPASVTRPPPGSGGGGGNSSSVTRQKTRVSIMIFNPQLQPQ